MFLYTCNPDKWVLCPQDRVQTNSPQPWSGHFSIVEESNCNISYIKSFMINKKYVNVLHYTYGLVPTSLSCTVPLYVCLCVYYVLMMKTLHDTSF